MSSTQKIVAGLWGGSTKPEWRLVTDQKLLLEHFGITEVPMFREFHIRPARGDQDLTIRVTQTRQMFIDEQFNPWLDFTDTAFNEWCHQNGI